MKTILAIALCFTFAGCACLQTEDPPRLPLEIGPETSRFHTPEFSGASFHKAPFRIVTRAVSSS